MQTLTNYEDCLERVQTESTVPKNCIKVNKHYRYIIALDEFFRIKFNFSLFSIW